MLTNQPGIELVGVHLARDLVVAPPPKDTFLAVDLFFTYPTGDWRLRVPPDAPGAVRVVAQGSRIVSGAASGGK